MHHQSQPFFYGLSLKSTVRKFNLPFGFRAERRFSALFSCMFIGGVVALSGVGCSSYSPTGGTKVQQPALRTDQARGFKPLLINSLAVMPFTPSTLAADYPPTLDDDFLNALEQRTSLALLNHSERAKVEEALKASAGVGPTAAQRASAFGKNVGAQGVLYGTVTKYQQSSGSKYGAEQLAAAGFRLWLIDPTSGQVLWSASYDNTEQPLSENLFRLGEKMKSGVGFRSADELMRLGFSSVADELQRLRELSATQK